MIIGRIVAWIFSVCIGFFGLIFVIASASDTDAPVKTLLLGLFLLAISGLITFVLLKRKPMFVKKVEITQRVELAGDTELERLKCESCGATLDSNSVHVAKDGSVLVNCQFCNSSFQITEKPKW